MSDIVLKRIRDLEGRLRVPERERYMPVNLRTEAARCIKSD